jgi:hypothetical protein
MTGQTEGYFLQFGETYQQRDCLQTGGTIVSIISTLDSTEKQPLGSIQFHFLSKQKSLITLPFYIY